MSEALITVITVAALLVIVAVNILFALWFHRSTKKEPVIAGPAPNVAKLISKQEAYKSPPSYDYQRTSMMGEPVQAVEPGDSDPPEPYE